MKLNESEDNKTYLDLLRKMKLQVTLPIFIIATSDMIPNNFDGGQTIHE
jgi:Cu2+-exporting ATPase